LLLLAMHSFFHALNIGTLATWLSFSGAGMIAITVHDLARLPLRNEAALRSNDEGPELDLEEKSASAAASSAAALLPVAEPVPAEQEEVQELMPELPELMEIMPLPEIPDFPEPVKPETAPKPPVAKKPANSARPEPRGAAKPAPSANQGRGSGSGSGTSAGNGSAASGVARWAGGHMPPPNYPSAARRSNQQGRVVVSFTVDEQGNVITASVTQACPFASLNDEAVRAVRRWKFKPGARASNQRTINFKLN
jgi:periplasmic protein TonB